MVRGPTDSGVVAWEDNKNSLCVCAQVETPKDQTIDKNKEKKQEKGHVVKEVINPWC